jgi:Uma2 family endonuclease
MGSQSVVPVEEYLAGDYGDRPAPEYRDGEVIERSVPSVEHSRLQFRMGKLLDAGLDGKSAHVLPELHLALDAGRYRVCDVAVFVGAEPAGIPSVPRLVDVEILSPDDTPGQIVDRFAELRRGV